MSNIYISKYEKAVDDYLSDLSYTGISNTTLKNYKRRLKYFEDFWAQGTPESDPSPDDIRNWRDSMIDKGTSKKTVRQYLVEISAFFSYCTDDTVAVYDRNPVSKRMYPRTYGEDTKPYDKLLTSDDIISLWENKNKRKNWARDYAIITLLLDGKMRNAELLDMKLSDIDFEHKEVVIPKGKGNKFRYVSLSDISLSAVLLYLESGIRPSDCGSDDYLFGTTAEHKFNGKKTGFEWHKGSPQWLSELTRLHVKSVTGKDGYRTHSLRHNGARVDLNNGMSLERIQSELGHASVTTTEIYAGKLDSRRHDEAWKKVIEHRDICAKKNIEMLNKIREKKAKKAAKETAKQRKD